MTILVLLVHYYLGLVQILWGLQISRVFQKRLWWVLSYDNILFNSICLFKVSKYFLLLLYIVYNIIHKLLPVIIRCCLRLHLTGKITWNIIWSQNIVWLPSYQVLHICTSLGVLYFTRCCIIVVIAWSLFKQTSVAALTSCDIFWRFRIFCTTRCFPYKTFICIQSRRIVLNLHTTASITIIELQNLKIFRCAFKYWSSSFGTHHLETFVCKRVTFLIRVFLCKKLYLRCWLIGWW